MNTQYRRTYPSVSTACDVDLWIQNQHGRALKIKNIRVNKKLHMILVMIPVYMRGVE